MNKVFESRNKRLDEADEVARMMLRLIGPRVTAADDAQDGVAIKMCRKCNPPPPVFICPQCDWECDERWRLQVHIALQPEWCLARGRKKMKAWAAKA